MKYTEEIFNILSKGGFISSNSISTQVKRYYDAIEEDLPDYYEYYQGIGLYLCREITKKLGHGIMITSEIGKGTDVTIVFERNNLDVRD
jgi:signal transduction histidine kinase